MVRAANFPYPAYLKPTNRCPDAHPRAAYEKIVADLAAELGLPVPPVLLFRREHCPSGEEPRACVSLVMYGECYELQKLETVSHAVEPVRQVVRSVVARSSGVIALDTFVANTDRNNNRNLLFGIEPGALAQAGFVFLDYANALNYGGQWEGGKAGNVTLVSLPSLVRESVDPNVLGSTLDAIEHLPESLIEEIVGRIPNDYMIPTYKAVVSGGLKTRRAQVRAAVTAGLGL